MVLNKGDRFNYLTVDSLIEIKDIGHKHTMHKYRCVCDCGNIVDVYQGELVGGHVKSCGCKTKIRKQPLTYDLTGQRFGYLTVLNYCGVQWSDSGKSRMVMWLCQCDCGNQVTVNSRALRTGATQSCGCYQKKQVSEALTKDLLGEKFGYLTVIERAGSYPRKQQCGIMAMWKCLCECGNTIVVPSWSLQCGDTVSCGCASTSAMEYTVDNILKDNGYIQDDTYFREKSFSDLSGVLNYPLRFDFVVHHNNMIYCIECQGEQHYRPVDYFGGEHRFKIQQANDAIKQQWCEKHNYKLICIPYTAHTPKDIKQYLSELIN